MTKMSPAEYTGDPKLFLGQAIYGFVEHIEKLATLEFEAFTFVIGLPIESVIFAPSFKNLSRRRVPLIKEFSDIVHVSTKLLARYIAHSHLLNCSVCSIIHSPRLHKCGQGLLAFICLRLPYDADSA